MKSETLSYCFLFFVLALTLPLFAQDIPEPIEKLGFVKYDVLKYSNDIGIQYYTFLNWMTKDPDDTVTFVVSEGEIVEIIKKNKEGRIRTKIQE